MAKLRAYFKVLRTRLLLATFTLFAMSVEKIVELRFLKSEKNKIRILEQWSLDRSRGNRRLLTQTA